MDKEEEGEIYKNSGDNNESGPKREKKEEGRGSGRRDEKTGRCSHEQGPAWEGVYDPERMPTPRCWAGGAGDGFLEWELEEGGWPVPVEEGLRSGLAASHQVPTTPAHHLLLHPPSHPSNHHPV